MNYSKHEKGICEATDVGAGTRIWAFAHVLKGAKIGRDCNICDNVFIENDVVIGDRVTVKCGVQLWDGIRLDDDVFVGPNATFTNDLVPRSKRYQSKLPQTIVGKGASIGANSTILPGLTIGRYAMIGAGTVVTRNVPPYALVRGNPGRIEGYVDAGGNTKELVSSTVAAEARHASPLNVEGVGFRSLTTAEDLRGRLAVAELKDLLPFEPQRFFLVHDVPGKYVRGEHAHKKCHQFLLAAAGSLRVVVDDGKNRDEVILNDPGIGLYVPNMVWATQYHFTDDTSLLVFASDPYDPDDYIRDYEQFLQLRGMM